MFLVRVTLSCRAAGCPSSHSRCAGRAAKPGPGLHTARRPGAYTGLVPIGGWSVPGFSTGKLVRVHASPSPVRAVRTNPQPENNLRLFKGSEREGHALGVVIEGGENAMRQRGSGCACTAVVEARCAILALTDRGTSQIEQRWPLQMSNRIRFSADQSDAFISPHTCAGTLPRSSAARRLPYHRAHRLPAGSAILGPGSRPNVQRACAPRRRE